MENFLDRSNYFRGILIIVAKDGKISEEERNFVMKVGKNLGFEKRFCQSAINEILDNNFIKSAPPEFKDKALAEKFLLDGIELAFADSNFHPKEIEFLKNAAIKNGFTEEWFFEKISHYIEEKR